MHTTPGPRPRDEGSALVITLMVMALLTALSTTVAVLTVNNLQSSWRAKQAGSALNAADAGVAQAMTYLRNNGVRGLVCATPCASGWGSSTNPTTEALPGNTGARYRAWIEPLAAYPANDPGRYRIHSTGTAAGAAAARSVTVDVTVTATGLPRGIFANSISGGGSASVTHESIFSTGCVSNRRQIDMDPTEIDLAYGIPVGVHSSRYITEKNNAEENCPDTDNKLIHRGSTKACNPAYPNDQDALGADLSGTPCAAVQTTYPKYYKSQDLDGDGRPDVVGSYLEDENALFKLFGINPTLTQAQLDQLRSMAQAQGNYFTSPDFGSGWSVPDENNAVMFFDLNGRPSGDRTIVLNPLDESRFDPTRWASEPNVAGCPIEPRSLVIVVEAGNVKFNANLDLAASLFLTGKNPYGQVLRANGTASFLGTIYADTVNLVGNVDISLNKCFLDNASPALLDIRAGSYREADRGMS